MTLLRKPTAALAAVTAAAAIAAPAASASAASTRGIATPRAAIARVPFTPPFGLCEALVLQIRANVVVNPLLANLLSQTFINLGCGGAAS